MGTSLWSSTATDLLTRTASADPTPGGGSVAALSGAFGIALLQMAVAVTDDPDLEQHAARLAALRAEVEPAADEDVAVFDALMAAYRLPREDEGARATRTAAVTGATVAATDAPLRLAETLAAARALSFVLEPLVKRGIRSDVLAGRDLIEGAVRAAVRTADINLTALERTGADQAPAFRVRRDAVLAGLDPAPVPAGEGSGA